MHAELKKDDASLQNKSSDRHRESRSHVDRNSDLLSGENTEGFASSPGHALPPPGQGQLVMQCKGLADSPEPTKISGPLIQRRVNNTGLPDRLKNGIENLSGYAMDDVRVHYNSSKPAQLQAHAYTQGTAIHVAPGQEQHLPHEAWHVVQQKQGRVKPTVQMKGKVNVNDDAGLEREADVMGQKVLEASNHQRNVTLKSRALKGPAAAQLFGEVRHNAGTGSDIDRTVYATIDELIDWMNGQTKWGPTLNNANGWCFVGGSAYERVFDHTGIRSNQNVIANLANNNQIIPQLPGETMAARTAFIRDQVMKTGDVDVAVSDPNAYSNTGFPPYHPSKKLYCNGFRGAVDVLPDRYNYIPGSRNLGNNVFVGGINFGLAQYFTLNANYVGKQRKREARQNIVRWLVLNHRI